LFSVAGDTTEMKQELLQDQSIFCAPLPLDEDITEEQELHVRSLAGNIIIFDSDE